jgi:hypothetical protein
MNEESLAKYIKALPDEMLGEYDAAVSAGANAQAGKAGTGTGIAAATGRGVRERNPRVFGTVLAGIAAVVLIVVGVALAIRFGDKNSKLEPGATNIGLASSTTLPPETETSAPEDTALPQETVVPTGTVTPAQTEFVTQTPEPTATATPTAHRTASPAPTANATATPTLTTEPTATATPTTEPTATTTQTPTQEPDYIKVNHLDPIITKGELYVGETVQLSYHVSPENYNYGTIRWKLTSGFDCATIDPVTGVLTALKPGSVGVLPYVEEYETKNSPAGLRIIEKPIDEFGNEEPEHEQELPDKYRPDADPSGDSWTQERINIRKMFLVYNGRTPDKLPSYKKRPTDEVSYSNSPYGNDLTLYVSFCECSHTGDVHFDRSVKQKGVKVIFTDAKTGKVVGYSYTNADGIAMFTIKKQEIDFIVSAELDGYNFDYILPEDKHLIYPGGGDQGTTGPYTNCGIARWYSMLVNSNEAVEYTFRVVNTSTGEVTPGGIIDIYYQESMLLTLDEEYGGYTAVAFDDFFDSIRTITYMYGENYPKKRVENCMFRRNGNIVTIYAEIPDETPTQIRIERVTVQGTKPTLYVAEGLQLTYTVSPANANYGTVRFRLTRGEDCAFLEPETGRLIALKEGSFAVEAYVVEYDISHPVSPQAIQVIDRMSEPQHERPLPDKYKPDELVFDGTMDESIINRRKALLVYNCATPDVLPVYMTEGKEYHTSPYGNDYIIYVNLYDAAKAERDGRNDSIVKEKGIPVYFMGASTGEMVGYSYTNADGIAMFTIKKQESLDLVVSVEMDGYTTSFPHPAEQGHIIPGQSEFIYKRAYVTSGEAERFLIPIAVDF